MDTGPEHILKYWFGDEGDDIAVSKSRASLWWGKNESTDSEIRQRFLPAVRAAANGGLTDWGDGPRAMLAKIILIDQFNRNIWRGDPRAFEDDALARDLASHLIESGAERDLRPIERVFAYLPLEHSESLEDQDRCVSLFETLRDSQQGEMRKLCEGYLEFALAHQRIVARFGRFPHRNATLGRESTDEELAFLSEPGSSF